MIEKLEFIFFARLEGSLGVIDEEEIYDWKWFSQDEFFAMEPGVETHKFMQELMEQNEDLLELL